jgi:hypothetical protein
MERPAHGRVTAASSATPTASTSASDALATATTPHGRQHRVEALLSIFIEGRDEDKAHFQDTPVCFFSQYFFFLIGLQ